MVIALDAPELLLFLAINERISANTLVKRVLDSTQIWPSPECLIPCVTLSADYL